MPLFTVNVDQRSTVLDQHIYLVEAKTKEEAMQKAQNHDYIDIIHSEELDRDFEESYWEDSTAEEFKKSNAKEV